MTSLLQRFTERWTYEQLPSHDRAPSRAKDIQWRRWVALAVVLVVSGVLWFETDKFRRRSITPLDNYQNINPLPVTIEVGMEHIPASRRAVVSALESNGYAIAVAVTGYSARSANVTARLLLPYLEHKVSERALCIVRAVGWEPYPVPLISPPHGGKGVNQRYAEQYTKLNIWNLDQQGVDSAVYLDADTLVRRNFNELFEIPFNFGAVPDVYTGWDPRGFSIAFNAGVLAFRPSSTVFEDMHQKINTADYPLREAEQSFLNLYFGGTCVRLPYIYNANLAIKDRSPVLWERLADEMRIVHYTLVKPFLPDPRSSKDILTSEEISHAMNEAARWEGGRFREEIGWWEAVYRRMMEEHGQAIRQCQ
ncbi:glycosyltransferase family 8 protein [Mycena galopus ATCC 62051]|nr:glycosyltransferase family 8 protein [Mycena galopus ATCC 62051]